jgi:hypothetical protein
LLLLWAPSACAAIVELSQISVPPGIVVQTSNLDTPVAVTTVTAPAVSGSYRFTHWTINGLRYDDDLGRSQNPIAFTLYEATVAIAHYLPATQDSDADALPDWYETEYYGSLAQTAASDTDGDGYPLAEEYALGFHPRLYDEVVAGGLSRVRSSSVTMNLDLSPTYRLISSPPGFVSVSNTVVAGTVVGTADLWGQANSGYRFAYWDLDGVRQQDNYGIALGAFSFTVTTNTVATAHYYPAAQDSDEDGVADWFEYVYYATLAQGGGSDTDGDGYTLAEELALGTMPTLPDEFVPGGLARVRSATVAMNIEGYPVYWLVSSPAGFVSASNFVSRGAVVTTPDLWGQANSGYRFAYWELDGVAQADAYGIALGAFSFPVNSNTVATAHYFPTAQDADADGVADWFEYVYYGGLTQAGTSDTDGDGFTLAQESAQNTVPTLADEFVPGGISRTRTAASITMDLQPFERLEYTLVDGVLSNVFRAFNGTGGMTCGANAAPALGDWDGDGDLDLFIGQAGGAVRVFENIGTRSALNLSERTANFASVAATWSGIGSPAPALGDWSGNGRADLAVGGAGGTVFLIASTGHFNAPQVPAVSVTLATASTSVLPALADVNGDARADLLVLLADGTVDIYLNSGNAALPFAAPPSVANLLGQAITQGTGLSVADLNYDGRWDVLAADAEGRLWEFRQSAGGGSFTLISKVWGGAGAGFANRLTVAAGDLDGDGDVDVIGGFAEGGLLALRDPRFAVPVNFRVAGGATSVLLSWDPDRQSRIVGYRAYRSAGPATDFTLLTNTLITLPRHEDRAPVGNVSNRYYVTAVSTVIYPGNSVPLLVEGRPSEIAGATAGGITLLLSDYFGRPGLAGATLLYQNFGNPPGTVVGTPFVVAAGPEYGVAIGSSTVGNEVIMAGGSAGKPLANLSQFRCDYWSTEAVTAQLFFYRNDGLPYGLGGPAMPGTVLYDSGPFPLPKADQGTASIVAGPGDWSDWGMVLPGSFTWALKFTGLTGTNIAGLVLIGPPTVGKNYGDVWYNPGTGWELRVFKDPLLSTGFAAEFVGAMVEGLAPANTILRLSTPNAGGVSGTNLDLRVTYDPLLLTPVSLVDSQLATVAKTTLTANLVITDNAATANGLLVITGHGGVVEAGAGTLFNLHFQVTDTAATGTCSTNTFAQATLQDTAGHLLPVDSTDIGVLTVANTYFAGDADGDGKVSLSDFTLLMELAVGQRPATSPEIAAGDLNGNGVIDTADAYLVLRMIEGQAQ